MAGLESDSRAGAVRADAGSLVSKASDLSPAIANLSDSFRKGFITAADIVDRFSTRQQAEDTAATEKANLTTRTSKAITPDLIQKRAAAETGALEESLFVNQQNAQSRASRGKIEQAKVAQALNEIQGGLPSSNARDLNMQYPWLDIQFDDNGVVTNQDDVLKKLPSIKAALDLKNAVESFDKQTSSEVITLPGGAKGVQTVWKGTNQPVPPKILSDMTAMKNSVFLNPSALQPGSFSGATPQPQQQTAPAPTTQQPEASPAIYQGVDARQAEIDATFRPGSLTAEGVLVTSSGGESADRKPTEVQAKSNKFVRRMELAETQYQDLQGLGYKPNSASANTIRGLAAWADERAIVGPWIKQAAQALPGVSQTEIENAGRANQAMGAFISGVLRDDSGAAVPPAERLEYMRVFFPVTNDPQDVIEKKRQLRIASTAAMKQAALGTLTDEAYEASIEQLTRRSFPVHTTTRGLSQNGSGLPSTEALGDAAAAAQSSDPALPRGTVRLKRGEAPPPGATRVWIEGEPTPRILRSPR